MGDRAVGQADINSFGVGCAGSNGTPLLTGTGDGKLGGTFGVQGTNCVANMPVYQAFGLPRNPVPVDLVIAGAPNCFLYQSTDLVIGGASDGSGIYSMSTPVPNMSGLLGTRVYTQIAPLDIGLNGFGATTSNYVRVLAGN